MLARLASLLLVLGAVACSSRGSTFIDASSLQGDVAFAIALSDGDRVIAWEGPVGLSEAVELPTQIDFEADAGRILMASWSLAQLEQASSLLRPEAVGRLDLVAATGECRDGAIDATGTRLDVAISDTTLTFFEEGESTATPEGVKLAFETQLRVRLPVDAERCNAAELAELDWVTPDEFPLQTGMEIQGVTVLEGERRIKNTHRLADGRIVVASAQWLYVVEPGKPIQPEGRHILPILDGRLSSMVVDDAPERNAPGTAHIIGVGTHGDAWAVFDFRLDENGLTRLRTTQTSAKLQHVALNPRDGRIVALGDEQLVTRTSSVGGAIEEVPGIVPGEADSRPIVVYTGWRDRPFVLGGASRGFAAFGAADGVSWESVIDGLDPSVRLKGFGGINVEGATEVWAGSSDGRLYRLPENATRWEPVDLRMPPSYICGLAGECGWQEQPRPIRTISSVRRGGVDRVYLAISECTTLLEMRADGACATFLRIPGHDLSAVFFNDISVDYRALDIRDGWLTLGGNNGGLYQLYVGD